MKIGNSKLDVYTREDSVYLPVELDFSKMDDDKHQVFGWANVAIQSDGSIPLDWQGDIIAPRILEKAAYEFVLKYRTSGEMHAGDAVGHLIESVMFTKDKMRAMGIPEGIVPEGWWVGFHVPDDAICEKIRTGEYKMFSIQGKLKKYVV